MGDRYDRNRRRGLHPALRALPKPPPEIMAWGLTAPARIGHNQGPPLEEPAVDLFVRYRWRKAHAEVWKNPSLSILRLRMARAEAAGVSYREYILQLVGSERHLQADDVGKAKGDAAGRSDCPAKARRGLATPGRKPGTTPEILSCIVLHRRATLMTIVSSTAILCPRAPSRKRSSSPSKRPRATTIPSTMIANSAVGTAIPSCWRMAIKC